MPSSKTGEDDTLLVLTDDSQKEVILEKEQGARISRCRFLELNKYYPEAVVISDAGDNKGSRKKYWHKGVANMAHEEKLEGARNAFAFYYAYVGAVAQEIGEEKALQLGADLDEILDILGSGARTIFEVAAEMTWDITASSWDAFPPVPKWFATGEAASHLRYLEVKGQIRRETRNGVVICSMK